MSTMRVAETDTNPSAPEAEAAAPAPEAGAALALAATATAQVIEPASAVDTPASPPKDARGAAKKAARLILLVTVACLG